MPRRRTIVGAIAAVGVVLAMGGAVLAAGLDRTAYAAGSGPLATTAGCGQAPTLTSGTHSIQSSGQNRTYILRVPDNYDRNHPYRLVFGVPLERRYGERRGLGRDRRVPLVVLRASGAVEQQRDLRGAAG